jgi:cholesterol transport system auxiliary component
MKDTGLREEKIMRFTIPRLCVSIISLLCSACVAERPIHYYAINRPAISSAPAKPDGPALLVGRIATPEALEDARIRYRSGSNEVGSYEYHRWTERPGMMVRDLLVQTLRGSGKYRQVQEASSYATGDYLIRGKLYEFSEIDDPGIGTRVSLQLEVVAGKTGLVVWSRDYKRDEPVNGKTMKDVVTSLDHNLQQVVADATSGIDSYLSNHL